MTGPETIEQYAARVHAAQDAGGGRLPLAEDGFTGWPGFPFEGDLRARSIAPLADADAVRAGEDPKTCWCHGPSRPADGWSVMWRDERWHLKAAPLSGSPLILVLEPTAHYDLADLPSDLAAEYGILTVRLVAAIETLPSVGRCHVSRWGDGGAHAHTWFIARPIRMPQLRGTFMAIWDDIVPPMPAEQRDANARFVIDRIVATYGGERVGD